MQERLSIAVTLTVGGVAHTIPGGNVRALSLRMTPYGVVGSLELVVQDDRSEGGKYEDALLADFVKPDLGTVVVEVNAAHWDQTTEKKLPPVQTRGTITEKSVREALYERQLGEPSVLHRYYQVDFADAARVLWGQHFPCDLLVTKTLQDLLDAHKSTLTLTYDWDILTTARPLIFVALDPDRGASFYDFVVWLADQYEGVLTYDHTGGGYDFAAAKSAEGQATPLARDDVASMRNIFPEIPRSAPRVVNCDADASVQRPIQDEQASAGIFRDILLRTSIQQEVDDRFTLESSRARSPVRELRLDLARYPLASVMPGSLLDISAQGGFSSQLLPSTEPWRVYALALDAQAIDPGPEESYGEDATGFEVELELRLESQSDVTPRLPKYVIPYYPAELEGKVVSEIGETTDLTYDIQQDQTTSLDEYRVQIPLFANQIVTAPFEPHQVSGMFYIPAYKGQKVLVELRFDRARIARLLDWREGARVPQDGQGQHLLLGKSTKSNTSMLHDYEDDKPVFQILRTNQTDTATVRIQEGRMVLQVKENQDSGAAG